MPLIPPMVPGLSLYLFPLVAMFRCQPELFNGFQWKIVSNQSNPIHVTSWPPLVCPAKCEAGWEYYRQHGRVLG